MQRYYKNFGQYLKRARKNCGLGATQVELAKKIGFQSGQLISNIEQGRCAVPYGLFPKLASLLDIDLAEMVDVYLADEKEKIMKLAIHGQYPSSVAKKRTKKILDVQETPSELFL